MSSQIQITGETKVKSLTGVLVGTTGVVSSLAFDVAGGVPKLDVNGKILVAQLPNSVMEYKGTWNAATNTPTLVNGTGNQGDVYLCNVAGTVNFGAGAIAFFVGDQVIYSGSIWQRASGATGTVTSVAITESGDSLNITGSPITTSGTINIGFNGTNLQYVNGAGNLTTFPILTGYVTAVSGTAPVVSSGGTTPAISMAAATGSVDGYLLATDFAIFNAKQSALTFSSPLVNTSGTISIPAATTSVNGYLASADFTIFNNKQNAITLTTTGSSGVSTLVGATLNIPNYGSALTGYVPYTGATTNVDLGTFNLTADVITGATGSFASNGGSDTFAINHSSGSGIALNITKGGNGEGLYINKTSGSGNAATIIGTLNATTLVKSGGTSSQFLKADGTVDSSTYALDSAVVHNTGNETIGGTKTFSDASKNNGGIFLQNASSNSLAGYMNLGGLTNGLKFTSGGGISNSFTLPSATGYTFTFPNATGTLALTSDIPSITGLVPYTGATASVDLGAYLLTASGVDSVGYTARGSGTLSGYLILKQGTTYLGNVVGYNSINANSTKYTFISDVDGTNYKQASFELGSLTNNTARTYTLPNANGTIALTSDLTGGTVTSVAALTIGTSGTDLSSTVATSTTTPVITLNVPTASATNRGALSSADWSTFNNKYNLPSLTSGSVLFSNGTTIAQDNANFFWDDTNNRLGIGTNSPTYDLTLSKSVAAGNVVLNIENTSTTGAARLWFGNNASSTGARIQYFGATHAARPNLFSIGTDIANDMMFETSGTERVRITSGGNVGIGTDSPAGKLTILNGTTYTPSAVGAIGGSVSARLQIQGGESGIMLSSDISPTTGSQTGTQAYQLGLQIGFYNVNDIRNQIYFGNAPLTFVYSGNQGTSVSEYMRIWSSTGNVNIGTTPASDSGYKLDVNGTGRFSGDLRTTGGNVGVYNSNVQVQFFDTANSNYQYSLQNYSGNFRLYNNTTSTTVLNFTSTGAATFSSSLEAVSFAASTTISTKSNAGSSGSIQFLYAAQVDSRTWRLASDLLLYGDFAIAQTTTQTGSTFSNKLYFSPTGAATFSSTLGINGVADNVKASTYSPTLTGVLNYTSGSGNICTFSRIANIVTVFFDINVNATAVLSKTECYISLPIPSTFTSFVGVGSGVGDVSSGYIPVLAAYGGGTNIVISFYSPATSGTYVYRGSFSYEVT
jgi:hypothetical protein